MRAHDYVLVITLSVLLTDCATPDGRQGYCDEHSAICVLAGAAAVVGGVELAASSGEDHVEFFFI